MAEKLGGRLLVEKEILTKEEFWEMVRVVDQERKRKREVSEVGYLYEIYGSWNGLHCFNITYAAYGAKKAFQVHLPGVNTGLHRVECYIEYIQGEEIRRTNVIATQVLVGT